MPCKYQWMLTRKLLQPTQRMPEQAPVTLLCSKWLILVCILTTSVAAVRVMHATAAAMCRKSQQSGPAGHSSRNRLNSPPEPSACKQCDNENKCQQQLEVQHCNSIVQRYCGSHQLATHQLWLCPRTSLTCRRHNIRIRSASHLQVCSMYCGPGATL